MHILKNIVFQCFFFLGHPRPSFPCSYQKMAKVELTSINRKFAYHIINIFIKTIEIQIHFIFSSTWIYFRKENLSSWTLIISDVSSNVNLNKILKFDLDYRLLGCIKTFLDYFDHLWKYLFAMIKQLEPPTFLWTFTTCTNN
jgi:hypothetical protein